VIEDVASEAANAAEMKAAATGNPLIFMQVQLSAELKKVEALFANYKRNQHSLESRVAWLADADKRADRAITRWNQEIALRDKESTEDFRFQTKDRTYGEKDRESLLGDVMYAMKKAIEGRGIGFRDKPAEIVVGRYRGFEIEVYALRDEIQFTLTGSDSYEPENLRYRAEDKFSINGFIQRIDNFMSNFEKWRQEAETAREKERREYANAATELGKPFPHQQRMEALRQDVRDVMTELKLMQADDNYISHWQPRSLAIENAGQQPERSRMRA